MAEKKTNRLAGLVKGASGDITPEPIRRGRGLEGLLSDEAAATPAARQAGDRLGQQDSNQTSQQVEDTTRQQVNKTASRQNSKLASRDELPRTVKSYRIRDDLAYRIDVLAATERRKIYEVVEEALELYLRARAEERAEAGG